MPTKQRENTDLQVCKTMVMVILRPENLHVCSESNYMTYRSFPTETLQAVREGRGSLTCRPDSLGQICKKNVQSISINCCLLWSFLDLLSRKAPSVGRAMPSLIPSSHSLMMWARARRKMSHLRWRMGRRRLNVLEMAVDTRGQWQALIT